MADTYKPTEAMAAAARRGLAMREKQPPSNRGMTSVGLTRARQLIARENLSLDAVKRMYSFFSRHEVDKSSDSWKRGDSKGEQAWEAWGGNAGYAWSKRIVESLEGNMQVNKIIERDGRFYVTGKDGNGNLGLREIEYFKTQNVLLMTNVSKSQIKDTGTHWEIKNIPIVVDDAVMNGVMYPADENRRGLPSLLGKPVTLGHPKDKQGNFVSGIEGDGLSDHFSGGTITNVYNMSGINYADAKVKKSLLEAQDGSEWYAEQLASKGDIGVSTGLTIPFNESSGESKGQAYSRTAVNQAYDHLAMLPANERPAGGDDTFMRFNEDSDECAMIVNVDEFLPSEKQTLKAKVLDFVNSLFADDQSKSYNESGNGANLNNGDDAMRETMIAELENLGVTVNSDATDAQLMADLKKALAANGDMSDKRKAMMEEMKNMGLKYNEDMSDEDMKNMIDKAKAKKEEMKGNQEDTPAWAAELITKVNSLESQLAANAQDEKSKLVDAAVAIGILPKEAAQELSVNSLKSHIEAHGGHLNVNAAGAPVVNAGKVEYNMEAPE